MPVSVGRQMGEVPGTGLPFGRRLRVVVALSAAVAVVWALRLVSAWADRTVALVTFVAFIAALVLLIDWLAASFGSAPWRLVRSVGTSVRSALQDDAEVRALIGRHPGFFGWLGRRFARERPSGLYLTLTAALALYFLSSFVSIALSLALSRAITDYDPRILALLRVFRTPGVTRLLWVATVLADPRVIPLLVGTTALLLVMWGRRAEAGLLVITLSGGALLQTLVRSVFARPRPPITLALIKEPASFSFPSGHAIASLLLAGAVVFVLWRAVRDHRARVAAVFVAALAVAAVGLSRVYLGVHWASDVIASWALALAWLCTTCGCYLMSVRYLGMRERWSAWSSRRARTLVTLVASLAAVVIMIAGAHADPLLSRAVAEPPARPWIVAVGPTGRPVPTTSDLRRLPLFSEKLDGSLQEPVGIVFIGTRTQLISAFMAAGWSIADQPSLATLGRAALAAIGNRPYATAPVTPTFLDGAVQDIAFEKPEGAVTVRRRHHARFWLTHLTLEGVPVWVATASFDSRLEIGSTIPLPTHHIDPNIDAEQTYVADDLVGRGQVGLAEHTRATQPGTGTNAQGDPWFTQGYVSVLEATR